MSQIAQNLYFDESSSSSTNSVGVIESVDSTNSSNVNFDFFNINPSNIFETLVISIGSFNLIWSVAISFILLSNFYFYFKNFSDKSEDRIDDGVEYIMFALNVWLRIIPVMIFYSIFVFNDGIVRYIGFALFVISSLIKWYFDLLDLCKKNGYFPWFNTFTTTLSKILKLENINKKK